MNKNELVAKMAEKAGLKKTEAEKALKAFTETVAEEKRPLTTLGDVVVLGGRRKHYADFRGAHMQRRRIRFRGF